MVCQLHRGGLAVFLTAVVVVTTGLSPAAERALASAPQSLAVAITIDAENLIELYQSVPGLRIVDSRLREDYIQGHIESSVNLPLEQTDCASLAQLASGRDQAFVFYCNGVPADDSIEAIKIASACGYKRLFWFRGGFVEWEDKDYPFLIE